MNTINFIKISTVLISTLVFTGCASTGTGTAPRVVQAIQVGDDTLTCAQLSAQIGYAETVISNLNKEIEDHRTMARTNDATGAINSYLGNSSVFSSLAASFSRDSVSDKREVRDSHQRRRDILLQQYMHKQCSVAS